MIPVLPSGVPPGFAKKVVAPAKRWATKNGWNWTMPPPPKKASCVPAHWRNVLDELHGAHGGVCAYLSVYMHRTMDSSSVDHFLPVSKSPLSAAYDWSNYRLASRPMNTNKGEHQDVLDPFTLPPNLFTLKILSARIRINTDIAPLGSRLHQEAQDTLERLKLNEGEYRAIRLHYLNKYLEACRPQTKSSVKRARATLLLESPFLHQEVVRQDWR